MPQAAMLAAAFEALPGVHVEGRGGPRPKRYFKVWGPTARHTPGQCWLNIEEFNCTVSFAAPLAAATGALLRPAAPINEDPRGYSTGPIYGRFARALVASELVRFGATERAIALELSQLARATRGVTW
jgi:hypothetical protein